jgi:hypothetical protein
MGQRDIEIALQIFEPGEQDTRNQHLRRGRSLVAFSESRDGFTILFESERS